VAVVAIDVFRLDHNDLTISIISDLLKIVLVADGIKVLTEQLRCRSGSDSILDFLLEKGPLMIGSSSELAVTTLLLKRGETASTETFLIGSTYAKLLVMGASSLVIQCISSGRYLATSRYDEFPSSIWLLAMSGAVVVAPTSGINGMPILLNM
jgi:hypothetical protein